jgi:hypothetical protein
MRTPVLEALSRFSVARLNRMRINLDCEIADLRAQARVIKEAQKLKGRQEHRRRLAPA